MADADIIKAVVALLASDPSITMQTGTDLYGEELPAEAVARMPIPAIVVRASGGASPLGESDLALDHQRIDVMAYGLTPQLANQLSRYASARLTATKRRVVGGVLIHWVNKAGGFFAARDTDGLWPQNFRSFQVLYSTQEILP